MTDPDAALASQLRNIERSTGRTLAEWAGVVASTGLAKHGEIVTILKREHGLTHGNANNASGTFATIITLLVIALLLDFILTRLTGRFLGWRSKGALNTL